MSVSYDMMALADALATEAEARSSEHTATVLRRDNSGTLWVRVAGGADESPVNGTVWAEAAPGDTVLVRIEGGRLSLMGNVSTPSVGATHVARAVEPVAETADQALSEAGRAQQAAEAAEADAARAHEAADAAQGSADDAAYAATLAEARALVAEGAANDAISAAGDAATAAAQAISDAASAQSSAQSAAADAASALASAARANTHANDALTQLSIVQDVSGTLGWISEHGTFSQTSDTAVVDGTVYFELVSGEYVPVAEPEGDPSAHGWYVLDVTDSQTDYIMAHLAVTQEGLWVLPSGMGQSQTARHAPGYKMLLANDGAYLYDASGHLVTTYGESITFDSSRPQYIGGENAYIAFYDSDEDGEPDSIAIAGNVTFSDVPTISQMLADVAQASSAAAEAVQTARDASTDARAAGDLAVLVITSTHGQLFKNGAESTVLMCSVFPAGGERLDTIGQVRERFGDGSYIQWRWMHEGTGEWGTLVSSDPHISQGGMWLTVTPDDVDSKTSFEASLVVPEFVDYGVVTSDGYRIVTDSGARVMARVFR